MGEYEYQKIAAFMRGDTEEVPPELQMSDSELSAHLREMFNKEQAKDARIAKLEAGIVRRDKAAKMIAEYFNDPTGLGLLDIHFVDACEASEGLPEYEAILTNFGQRDTRMKNASMAREVGLQALLREYRAVTANELQHFVDVHSQDWQRHRIPILEKRLTRIEAAIGENDE